MHISTTLCGLLSASSLAAALPASATYAALPAAAPTAKPGEFFLVTTDQAERSSNTSTLRGVSATTPYQDDPLSSYILVLRLLAPGYNILPAFNLTSANTLSTFLDTGRGEYTYDTAPVVSGQQLQFLRSNQTAGNIGVVDGYLVTVDGESKGWTVCKTERGTELLYWKGTDQSCKSTFLQAVTGAPYRKR